MPSIHERILSAVGEVGLEVILNIAFILFSPIRDDCDEVYDDNGCNDDDDGWADDCGFGMF